MSEPPRDVTIMLVAGEPSGDQLGAQLMAAFKRLDPGGAHIVGAGGAAMMAQGLKPLFTIDATSVMGLREVVPRLPGILRRVRQASDFALKSRPDALVIIDSPDFTHRIAQRLKRFDRSIPVINYAPPQVWASRSYRAKKMARYIDAVINFFPFESEFFRHYGIPAYCAGYPVVERAERIQGGAEFRKAHGIAASAPVLAVLPGSRRNEIRFILPPFRRAVEILAREIPGIVSVIPTVGHVAALVRTAAANWPTPVRVIDGDAERFAALAAADAGLAASGTVTTELALARKPMVVGYKLGWLTFLLARPFVHVSSVVLINLVLGREAVPEFIQSACTPAALARAVKPLLIDQQARAKQLRDLDEAIHLFGLGGEAPSVRAARMILAIARRQIAELPQV